MNRVAPLGLVALMAAGCGDNLAPRVEVQSPGAVWIAYRPRPAEAWTRVDGGAASFDADPTGQPYDVVVVCRADVGAGWSLTASYEDGLGWSRGCAAAPATTVTLGFDVTGPVHEVWVRDAVTVAPTTDTLTVPAGESDVLAIAVDSGLRPARVQLQRGLVLDRDQRVAIDVAGRGVDLKPVAVTVDGATPTFAMVQLVTAGATRAPLSTVGARVLPDDMIVPGDTQTVEARKGDAWAKVAIDERDLDVSLPAPSPNLGFTWTDRPAWQWSGASGYRATLTVVDASTAVSWTVFAYPGALTARTAGLITTQGLEAPAVPGWDPAWWPAHGAADTYTWSARLTRDRQDGGTEGFTDRATIGPTVGPSIGPTIGPP